MRGYDFQRQNFLIEVETIKFSSYDSHFHAWNITFEIHRKYSFNISIILEHQDNH